MAHSRREGREVTSGGRGQGEGHHVSAWAQTPTMQTCATAAAETVCPKKDPYLQRTKKMYSYTLSCGVPGFLSTFPQLPRRTIPVCTGRLQSRGAYCLHLNCLKPGGDEQLSQLPCEGLVLVALA
ncbi:Chromodomain-Helicase-Dna-Binding Protein 6 [Manis pentadactyla]|nr:Chromodomain-Helicase-Dna-Binding Protein 6 [Manis pentadactyla]